MSKTEAVELTVLCLVHRGGELLLQKLPSLSNLEYVDLSWHFLSDEMMEKLAELPLEINLDDQQEAEEYRGEIYRYPMLTE